MRTAIKPTEITDRQQKVLCFIGDEIAAGRVVTVAAVRLGVPGDAKSCVERLRIKRLVTRGKVALTEAGQAIYDGRAEVAELRPTKGISGFRKLHRAKPPEPPPSPKPTAPPVSAGFAQHRGITHPSLSSLGYQPSRAAASSLAGWS